MESYDTKHTKELICPHCGTEIKLEHLEAWGTNFHYECDYCLEYFKIDLSVDVTYSTSKCGEGNDNETN